MDVLIKQAADLRDKGINPVKPSQSGLEQILLFFLQLLKPIKRRADGPLELAQIAAGLLLGGIENFRKTVNFHLLIDPVFIQCIFQIIHNIRIRFLFQYRFLIIRFKRLANIFGGVDKIQDKGILFSTHGAVQPGKGLDSFHAG